MLNSYASAMHSIPNFAVLEHTSRAPNNNKQPCSCQTSLRNLLFHLVQRASVSTLNHQIFTYFVQRRSFLSSCYHFNLKEAFKVNNLAPMTMHHGRCYWSRALCQVSGRACSCKKDPCCFYIVLIIFISIMSHLLWHTCELAGEVFFFD